MNRPCKYFWHLPGSPRERVAGSSGPSMSLPIRRYRNSFIFNK